MVSYVSPHTSLQHLVRLQIARYGFVFSTLRDQPQSVQRLGLGALHQNLMPFFPLLHEVQGWTCRM